MEKQKITLETATTFRLPSSEMRTFYVSFALLQYCYLRKPDYNENVLLHRLRDDLKQYIQEAKRLNDQSPNSHQLHLILSLFENHYKHLLKVIEVEKELEQGEA